MLRRTLAAEALGTLLLVAIVVGSGIMAQRLSGGSSGLALLANTLATGAGLYVLITLFGPVSGAQFNPAVTLILGQSGGRIAIVAAQLAGGCLGAVLANLMFDTAPVSFASQPRTGTGQWLSEFVATGGLILTIRLGGRFRPQQLPALVAAWIVAAYWFTASTSFANPAVTVARALTASFAGIRWADVAPFIVAQVAGGWCGARIARIISIGTESAHERNHLA